MLRSNIAACYLKIEDWKAAVDSATACVECLNRVLPPSTQQDADTPKAKEHGTDSTGQEDVIEISGDDEEAEQEELKRLQKNDERRRDVARIRAKALMRRAKAKLQQGGWANLQGAEEDYKELASMDTLPSDDRRIVQKALRELPAKINQAKDKEMADMMGKLKDVSLIWHIPCLELDLTNFSWAMVSSAHLDCRRITSTLFKIPKQEATA